MTDAVAAGNGQRTLREHRLTHITRLHVDPSLLERRFAAGCSMAKCTGTCCSSGVWVDSGHRDRVLAHADLIRRYMEPAQEHDEARWFDGGELLDDDFESGLAYSTAERDGACVFLDGRRRCVLQLAEAEAPRLKPFYCWAYPIAIDHGTLTLDDEMCPDATHCCGAVAAGPLGILEVCRFELEHVLGPSGVRELAHMAREAEPTPDPATPNGNLAA